MVGLSIGEKHLYRIDPRPINVKTGVISQANGLARVRMGATDVIAECEGITAANCAATRQRKGFINVDCSPTAAPMFEVHFYICFLLICCFFTSAGRGGKELSAELWWLFNVPLFVSGAGIDLSSLVVVEGKICWDLYIDGLVVSSDGNLLDALGAAIKAALSDTGIPRVNVAAGASGDEQPEVDVSDEEFLQFDTSKVPVIVTLTKAGKQYIVDATSEEESQMSSAVSISVNRQGHICGLIKRGGAGLDPSIILDMVSVAKTVSEQLINTLDSQIAAAEAGEDES
ncbi:exosome complex component RRP42 [Pyrus ussuriensis x Pyrus communis]|uniref:Ribosomal RNA-processing protein 42 n=1 Tax=Pyrus ussuriensis x Pyrus communis TaxID=2448454 RepID=A0A5N5GEE9_9ROSA|nr:exosome complex component RRP42 [Pyrus ussuriensis x Pyrus communis]